MFSIAWGQMLLEDVDTCQQVDEGVHPWQGGHSLSPAMHSSGLDFVSCHAQEIIFSYGKCKSQCFGKWFLLCCGKRVSWEFYFPKMKYPYAFYFPWPYPARASPRAIALGSARAEKSLRKIILPPVETLFPRLHVFLMTEISISANTGPSKSLLPPLIVTTFFSVLIGIKPGMAVLKKKHLFYVQKRKLFVNLTTMAVMMASKRWQKAAHTVEM